MSLREHLYRRHLLPTFKCIRCTEMFKTSEQLSEHGRAEVACEVVQDDANQQGINQDQLTQLRSRKRSRNVDSEHDKWVRIYKILFPDAYLTPSPCECPDHRRIYASLQRGPYN